MSFLYICQFILVQDLKCCSVTNNLAFLRWCNSYWRRGMTFSLHNWSRTQAKCSLSTESWACSSEESREILSKNQGSERLPPCCAVKLPFRRLSKGPPFTLISDLLCNQVAHDRQNSTTSTRQAIVEKGKWKNALRALNVLKAQLYKSYISGCGRAAGGASVGLDGRSGQLLLGKSPVGRLRGPVGDWLA